MSKVSCEAAKKHRRCLCEWRGRNCISSVREMPLMSEMRCIAAPDSLLADFAHVGGDCE